jgi:hypothetical protein
MPASSSAVWAITGVTVAAPSAAAMPLATGFISKVSVRKVLLPSSVSWFRLPSPLGVSGCFLLFLTLTSKM